MTKRTSVASIEGLMATHGMTVFAVATTSKLKPYFIKSLSATSSFLYGTSTADAVKTNHLVRQLLPHTIALYVKYTAQQDSPEFNPAIARAIACCVAYPVDANSILSCMQTILTYYPQARKAIGDALFQHVNTMSWEMEERLGAQDASRQSRETVPLKLPVPQSHWQGSW